jgi:transcriptional regulator with GAF, ATPase, and Fis domain
MRRIGSVKDRRVRVRVLIATNRDMAEEVRAKRFREDLYYRINVMTIELPPLRDRGDDVLLLADHFAGPEWQWEAKAREAVRKYWNEPSCWPTTTTRFARTICRPK